MLEFQQKYIDDAGELITRLESELINFENDRENETIIQELFRVMHTLKGTSAMFGFIRIEALTHLLEDIYDLIRNKHLTINQEILNLTFSGVDLLKLLLSERENLNEEQEHSFEHVFSLAQKYSTKKSTPISSIIKSDEIVNKNYLYRVIFKPDPGVLQRGIKPHTIIDELKSFGKYIYFEFVNPKVDNTDGITFNKYYEFFLAGDIGIDAITDVFMFFDESEYHIVGLTNSSETALTDFISNAICVGDKIEANDLKNQIEENLLITIKKLPDLIGRNIEKSQKQVLTDNTDDTIRVSAHKLDKLLNLVSELIIVHAQFENHSERIQDERLIKSVKDLSKISRSFRDEILTTRLIPIAFIATGMQRLVRDLAQKLGKEIELITEGLQTELDKNIINRIENPIMHIIRNCIDHGLETPEERINSDKSPIGVIRFIAFYSGASVFIQVQDDGRGINTNYIFEKAVSKGIIKYDSVLTNKQIYDLMFIPGFSTAAEITEVSGRGVGLDVVKKVITELHGEINVDSETGLGTSFTLKLPLTLSIVDALLVHVNEYKILVPTGNIQICKYLPSDFFGDKDLQYQFDKKCVPVKRLSSIFSAHEATGKEFEVLIIIAIYDKLFGILVDKIVNSLQAVIKPLGEMHNNQPYFVGASQLGDGSMAYILDTNFLLKI